MVAIMELARGGGKFKQGGNGGNGDYQAGNVDDSDEQNENGGNTGDWYGIDYNTRDEDTNDDNIDAENRSDRDDFTTKTIILAVHILW